jgi:hypothetical protein
MNPPEPPALALAPGAVAELSVAPDGRLGDRLATPAGNERFVLILASTALQSSAAPSRYSISLGAARRAGPSRAVTGCSLSSARFATTALSNETAPTGPAPAEGTTRSIHIPTPEGGATIEARALSVGRQAVIWADTTHPTSLDQAFVAQFRDDFEQVFGTEPDLDHDGRIQLVFTRLTRERGVAFFSACDLSSQLHGCSGSNQGEYLYLTPPDAIKPPYNTPNAIKEILAHEIAHLLHFNRKVLRNHLDRWEDPVYASEGIGALAQDVIGYQAGNLYVTRAALDGIDRFSLTPLVSGAEPKAERDGVLRGGAYLFIRYLYDRAGGDVAQGLEIQTRGGPAFLRALIDSPLWIDEALPKVASTAVADLALDFYTTLALSNREDEQETQPEEPALPAQNPCFRYLPTAIDPLTQKQRGANLFARFHGSQMSGPQLTDAHTPSGELESGGVQYLSLEAAPGTAELAFQVQTEPHAAVRARVARWK